jgi:curved DNA-binding protein CbpA
MENLDRYYRVLGLPPRASKAEVKRAYRDLAMVWHPDRFIDNLRLLEKAAANLRRINEAYEKLQDLPEPAVPARRVSRLSTTYQAIVDMGDMVRTSLSDMVHPQPRRQNQVLGLDNTSAPKRSRGRRSKKEERSILPLVVVFVFAVVVAIAYLIYR